MEERTMSLSLPPPPNPEERQSTGATDGPEVRRRPRRGRKSEIPTVDELLKQIMQVNGMVVLKHLSPQAASTILTGLKVLLEVQREREAVSQEQLASEALVAACRRDPQLVTLLEPLLTDEQLDTLVKEAGEEDADGAVE